MTRRDPILALLTPLRRYAYALTRDRAEADDLVQDACCGAMNSAGSWPRARRLDPGCVRSCATASWIAAGRRKTRHGARPPMRN
ncbi:sigma factor [Paracoccus actinidiae]|uniref:sigma factor n=1 Tax=Paracoccus actinidiae TaxID=3064531 RepID=UPI0027D2C25A|nr:sigma factor [Paracoccus sp. M09]